MKEKFKKYFNSTERPKVLVIGDLILDEYIWGSVNRISPEAPVPILETRSENLALGGAANVANNLVGLGCEVHLCGAIGQDEKGDKLLKSIHDRSIQTEGIFRFVHRPTTSKIRVVAHNQQILRIDKEDNRPITEETEKKLIQYINQIIPKMDGVICSDYQKGVLTEKVIRAIMHRAQQSQKTVIVDPKSSDFSLYKGASVITPNEREVARSVPIKIKDTEDLGRAAEYLLNLTRAEAILITRGKDGMSLYQNKEKLVSIPTVAKEVFDVTGAGDTVISVFSMAVFVGFNYEEAAWLSNMAASVVVGKIGTAVVTLDEINEFLHEEMLRTAHTVLELAELKIIVSLAKSTDKKVVFTNGCFDIIHAGHIEFLQKAKALGDILVVGLNTDQSVKLLKGENRPIKNEKERANILSAIKYIDYITLFSDTTPEKLIQEIRPDILVKGNDYNIDDVVGREIVEGYGAKVELIPIVEGLSTTQTLENILEKHKTR
ncbi:MAG: D-glycero-beta-D-manno-heptose-7-phosphate kinase [Nitrospinaceae bacterium]|nr:D-glycero-beta-D-manno-heptose-7-phosphate kinase [Nitrospina sp.]MBT5377358.1 D-glycero-beta-D-manno-heptose-7-phosphate kinase [Nitrospinaceae bacterium]MBT5867319.1 D-glycero-beta-D-manno-heptose-7-phosphate kinase [Nitrospinaceae bacterium]MBT6346513.1 D-glycero-beta-D-manno-heptose-7-phosphate kinase [Nitrospina sp.]